MSPEGYQYIMSQPPIDIEPAAPPVLPPHPLVEPAPSTGSLAGGLELRPVAHSQSDSAPSRLGHLEGMVARMDALGDEHGIIVNTDEPAPSTGSLAGGLELRPVAQPRSDWAPSRSGRLEVVGARLGALEDEYGVMMDTDDIFDDPDALEDCFAPQKYKKAHRANPPPPHTHKCIGRQGFKLQFPSFKFQTNIQVRVSSCNFASFKFRTKIQRQGFKDAISKFQDSHQDPGQGFKMQFPSFKIHTKIQVRVSRCNFQVSRFTPRSRSGFQDAISKFQDSNQDPGQGFKMQFPSFKIHTKIQVRVSRCNFQVSRFTPRSRSGFQDAISKFQDSNQDPGQGFKMQFPSFKFQTKIQVKQGFQLQFPSFKFQTKIQDMS